MVWWKHWAGFGGSVLRRNVVALVPARPLQVELPVVVVVDAEQRNGREVEVDDPFDTAYVAAVIVIGVEERPQSIGQISHRRRRRHRIEDGVEAGARERVATIGRQEEADVET